MFRIQKDWAGMTPVLRLSGRIRGADIGSIQAQLGGGGMVILEMTDVTLVDIDVVRFLSGSEMAGVTLFNCPRYIREWISLERRQLS